MTINDYKDYGVIDFVEDEHFRKWTLEKDESLQFFWEAVFKKFPKKRQAAEEAKQLLEGMHTFFEEEVEQLSIPQPTFFEEISAPPIEHSKPKNKSIKRRTILSWVAAASVVFIMFLFFNLKNFSHTIEYTTGNGEWETITLPDGSKVELNANSQLSILNDWADGEDREVWLKGEGFFKVEKKPSSGAKFFVITKDLKVEVLGTTFNVNTRNQQTEVFLEEGKITLSMDDKKEEIEPGEFVAYSQEKKKIVQRYKKTEEIHSKWKDGVLKIDDAPMKEILDQIETIYGIDLIVSNKAVFQKEGSIAIPVDDLEMAAAILERVLNVKTELKGKQLFIK